MTADEAHDLVALYVVNALGPEETRDFEAHLAGCAECQKEVADMRSITDLLSRSVDADPPASLRDSVLANIGSVAQEPRDDAAAAAPGVGDDQEAGGSQVSVPDKVIRLRTRMGERLAYLVAAAAVLLALGFGGWALHSRDDAHQASERQFELVSLLGARDVRTVSAPVTGGGSGTVVWSRSRDQAVFVSSGLGALPDDKVYELWTITSSPSPAGTFTADGTANLVDLPTAALSASTIAMTVEPMGGSPQPTTTPILALNLPHSS